MTVLDLVKSALWRIGVLGAVEEPEPEDASTALRALNALVDWMQTQRLAIYTVTRTTWAMTAGTASYAVGGARPVFVDRVHYLDAAGYERKLELLTDAQYADIPDKDRQGIPTHAYYNPTYPDGTITIYPVPDDDYTGVFYAPNPVQEFDSTATVLSLPPGYRLMLETQLAIHCAPLFSRDVSNDLKDIARTALAAVKRSNVRLMDLTIDTPFRHGRRC